MAILNRNQELPRDRPELYNQASRVLLHQWDIEQKLLENPRVDSVAIDYKDKQAMLRQVAYHMQAADKGLAGNLIRGDDLEKILTSYLKSIEVSQARTVARLLIEQLRSRNFILCFVGADSYAFVHRTFLEYFCASEFVERFGKRGLEAGLTLEELKTEIFGKHWQDKTWHEVLALIAGIIEAKFTGEVIEYLIEQDADPEEFSNLFLAAKCLSEVKNRSQIRETNNKMLKQMKCLTQHEGYLGRVFQFASQAVEVIATTWKEDAETLLWLKACAQSNNNEDVRCAAVWELARGWKDDPQTLPWLRTQILSNDNEYVRQVALRELAHGWKDDPQTLLLLKTHALPDKHPAVRCAAMQGLARGWKDDPQTLLLLKTCVLSDENKYVRWVAMQELAHGWKDEPDTLPTIKTRALSDDDGDVRGGAVEELARGWKDEPGMFEFLCDRALNDPFERKEDREDNPRQLALKIIIKQYPDYPQTLPLLQDRAENDPDEKVREFAKKKLAELDQ
jgi:hypothetical protein